MTNDPITLPAKAPAGNAVVPTEQSGSLVARGLEAIKNRGKHAPLDPEMLQLGTEMAAFYIEAGVRSFADLVAAMMNDLEGAAKFNELKPYLRAWYTGAQALLEDHGIDVSGMDDPTKVRSELDRLIAEEKQKEEAGAPPAPERKRTIGGEVTEGQTPYEPASQAGVKLNTLLPGNLRDALTQDEDDAS